MTAKMKSARLLNDALEIRTRANGDKFYCLKDGSPQWMTDAIHAAHGDAMPDDWVYATCNQVAGRLAELDGDATKDEMQEAIYEIESDIYNSDLLKWASGDLYRAEYVDSAIREGAETLWAALSQGQAAQIVEVGNALLAALPGEDDAETDEAQP